MRSVPELLFGDMLDKLDPQQPERPVLDEGKIWEKSMQDVYPWCVRAA